MSVVTRKVWQIGLAIVLFMPSLLLAQTDSSHYSAVFKTLKPYRIFLPADYTGGSKRYPVIYYFHGNQGDHRLSVDGIGQLVNEQQVILVAWNGQSAPGDKRPYNIGYHSNVKYLVQFKDYFIELVAHIDSNYRTLSDRQHRALMGHSMGGFMSLFLAGKYPHLVSCAVSMKGSSEFFVGYPDNHSLYTQKDMFKNLYGLRIRFHNSTVDELVNLNNEVNKGASREQGLLYYYKIYPGGHSYTPAEFSDAFNFIGQSFLDPLPAPTRWHHADLYPDFDVWGYRVHSDLQKPGFLELRGVTKGGMQIRTRKWQPDGPLIPDLKVTVQTAPVYKPDTRYTIFDYNETDSTRKLTTTNSDHQGRIRFSVNNQSHQLGIFTKKDPPEIVFAQYRVNSKSIFLSHNQPCSLGIRLLNRGGASCDHIQVEISTADSSVSILQGVMQLGHLPAGELAWLPVEFVIKATGKPTNDGTPFRIRFNLKITDKSGHQWLDEFDAPVFYDVPVFSNIGIDDGDSEIFGSGNGDNIADPGETIMVYQDSHRTRLYYDDPYIDSEKIYDELQPDKWGDGYALSSLVHISKDCPPGHQIKLLASYEVKDWNTIRRNVTWGSFTIKVGGAR